MPDPLTWVLVGIPTTAGIAAGTVYLYRGIRNLIRTLDAIQAVVTRELEHNHGSSMKDDVYGIAVAMGELQRQQDDVVNALRRQHPDDPMFWKDNHR